MGVCEMEKVIGKMKVGKMGQFIGKMGVGEMEQVKDN